MTVCCHCCIFCLLSLGHLNERVLSNRLISRCRSRSRSFQTGDPSRIRVCLKCVIGSAPCLSRKIPLATLNSVVCIDKKCQFGKNLRVLPQLRIELGSRHHSVANGAVTAKGPMPAGVGGRQVDTGKITADTRLVRGGSPANFSKLNGVCHSWQNPGGPTGRQ